MAHDDRIIRIEDKLDVVVEKIGAIDVTLAKQHESLKHHIKRTDILESQIKPIKKHVDAVHTILKLVGLVAVLATIAEGVVEVLTYLKNGHL